MSNGDLSYIVNIIWAIADDVLRDLYVWGKYRDVILQWLVATVIGIEAANGMRKVAAVDGRHLNASYVGGRAEHFPSK